MKIIRVPWIRCRADELGAECFSSEWRGCKFDLLAHGEREAREWWRSLSEAERDESLGLSSPGADDTMTLF